MKEKLKKALLLTLVATTLTVFIACDNEKNADKESEYLEETENFKESVKCAHEWVEATCTEAKICSLCNDTVGNALEHTTYQGVCERCGEYVGTTTWELGEFVDEFKQPTGDKFVSTTVIGQFSNSATTNSELTAILQLTSEDIGIMLAEYCYNIVKCSYDSDDYNVIILDTNGNKHYMTGTMYEGGSRIYFNENDEMKIFSALSGTGNVSFYIEDAERTTTHYLFTVETSNFMDLYNQL